MPNCFVTEGSFTTGLPRSTRKHSHVKTNRNIWGNAIAQHNSIALQFEGSKCKLKALAILTYTAPQINTLNVVMQTPTGIGVYCYSQ